MSKQSKPNDKSDDFVELVNTTLATAARNSKHRNYRRWRGCRRKEPYYTEQIARVAALRMQQKYGVEFNHYKCQYCAYWHVGKPNKKYM